MIKVLATQGLVPLLLQRIAQIFPVPTIYTPFDQVSGVTLQPPACNILHEFFTPHSVSLTVALPSLGATACL